MENDGARLPCAGPGDVNFAGPGQLWHTDRPPPTPNTSAAAVLRQFALKLCMEASKMSKEMETETTIDWAEWEGKLSDPMIVGKIKALGFVPQHDPAVSVDQIVSGLESGLINVESLEESVNVGKDDAIRKDTTEFQQQLAADGLFDELV